MSAYGDAGAMFSRYEALRLATMLARHHGGARAAWFALDAAAGKLYDIGCTECHGFPRDGFSGLCGVCAKRMRAERALRFLEVLA